MGAINATEAQTMIDDCLQCMNGDKYPTCINLNYGATCRK